MLSSVMVYVIVCWIVVYYVTYCYVTFYLLVIWLKENEVVNVPPTISLSTVLGILDTTDVGGW